MSALSRGLLSHFRLLSLNPATCTATTNSSSSSNPALYHFLRRFSSESLLDASEIASQPTRILQAKPAVMTPNSKRTGLVAVKCGMSALWDKWGARVPFTILWVDDNIVSQVKTIDKDCTTALQVPVFLIIYLFKFSDCLLCVYIKFS